MERLTYRGLNSKGYVRNHGYYNYVYAQLEIVADRLAAIEDILGDEYDIDHLRELVEAEREGQLSPVKPGDVLYEIDPGHGIVKHSISEVGWYAHSDAVDDVGKSWWDHWGPQDIGTAYKTRAGAEAALGGGGDGR